MTPGSLLEREQIVVNSDPSGISPEILRDIHKKPQHLDPQELVSRLRTSFEGASGDGVVLDERYPTVLELQDRLKLYLKQLQLKAQIVAYQTLLDSYSTLQQALVKKEVELGEKEPVYTLLSCIRDLGMDRVIFIRPDGKTKTLRAVAGIGPYKETDRGDTIAKELSERALELSFGTFMQFIQDRDKRDFIEESSGYIHIVYGMYGMDLNGSIAVASLFGPRNRYYGSVTVDNVHTHRSITEEQLPELGRYASAAVMQLEQRTSFVDEMNHTLRSPLTTMGGNVRRLLKDPSLPPNSRTDLEGIMERIRGIEKYLTMQDERVRSYTNSYH